MLFVFEVLQQSQGLAVAVVAVLGLCVGSFLNVVIYRTPLIMRYELRRESALFWQEEPDLDSHAKAALKKAADADPAFSLSSPASACPTCKRKIRWRDNVPVLSWLWLQGKCHACKTPISARYPLVEIATAVLSVAAVLVLGVNLQGLLALPFVWFLVALTGIDFDTQLLPDRLVYPLGFIGFLANTQGVFVAPIAAMWGAALGFLSLWSVAYVYALVTKKEGMGYGDFKLLAALGAWLGASALPLIIFLSALMGCVAGSIAMRRHGNKPFAFGPYIAAAGFLVLLFGQNIWGWYLGFFAR